MIKITRIGKNQSEPTTSPLPSRTIAWRSLGLAVVALALAALLAGSSENGLSRLLHSYLLNVSFITSIAIGALFFVLLQHLTRAGWSVVIRRIAEVTAATMPYLLLLFLPILVLLVLGNGDLYEWNDTELRQSDELIRGKSAYLNAPFFTVRVIAYFVIWSVTARYFWKASVEQDRTARKQLTLQMQKWSAPAMIAFAITTCFAAFDLLMSLDPHWFSTIYGVYFFAGAIVGFVAFLTLAAIVLEKTGILAGKITVEHYHDLGKLLLGFVMFWAYIAFSQYLLIWYANIPEETGWYYVRQNAGWQWISLVLLFGHFALPFCGLMSRNAKRRRSTLAAWSVWLLVMHWLDLHWLVMPSHSPLAVSLGLVDALVLIGVVAIFAAMIRYVAGDRALVAVRDPRLRESLAFHNV